MLNTSDNFIENLESIFKILKEIEKFSKIVLNKNLNFHLRSMLIDG